MPTSQSESLTAIALLVVSEWIGLRFYNANDLQYIDFLHLLINIIGLAAIAGMAFIYEFTTSALARERDIEHQKVNQMACTDALIGLANRLDFDAELAARIIRYSATVPRSCFALYYLDLDGFKPINDRFDHAVGDVAYMDTLEW